MKIREFVNRNEATVCPFDSIVAIEDKLLKNSYVVIKDRERFVGILTSDDVLETGHNLVIDCYSKKELIDGDEEADKVLNKMLMNGNVVLPVVDRRGVYLGSVQAISVFRQIWTITKQEININWVNVVSDATDGKERNAFSSELFHNTRNPVQVILSAVDLLRNSADELERNMLLNSIESNARLLDAIITKLYSFHFEKANPEPP
jgi:FOG: CBS domain